MKYFQKQLFIFIIVYIITITNEERLTPLSECTKGRITPYKGWETGGKCGFGPHKNATSSSYLYPVSPNYDLFNSYSHCGACYEIVGPYGAIRTRVEDYCPKNDEQGLCTGDMYHFNVANNGSTFLMGDHDISNVTFRMVECGFTGNVRILTDEEMDEFSFSFIVLDHNLPISYVSIKENGTSSWTKLNRNKNDNHWKYEVDLKINLPLSIRIYSINGDYVTVEIKDLKPGQTYEANENFITPEDTYFNIKTFNTEEIPDETEECCERDKSDFNRIYKDGKLNDGYNNLNQKAIVDYDSDDLYQNQTSMNVKFQSLGEIIFQPIFPIRADQFSGVLVVIKTKNNCTNCLNLRAYDIKNEYQALQLNTDNEWKSFRFSFDTLGINDEFNGIAIKYSKSSSQPYEINIGNIELLGVRNPPSAGICVDVVTVIDPPVIPLTVEEKEITDMPTISDLNYTNNQTDIVNATDIEIVTDIVTVATNATDTETGNNTVIQKENVVIKKIESMVDYPLIITVDCEPFQAVNDEIMTLLFTSTDNLYSFETESCILPNAGPIFSFSCKIPNNIPNGVYTINSPSVNKYNILSSSITTVIDGTMSFNPIVYNRNNNKETDVEEITKQDQNSTVQENSTIIITKSIDRVVNRGDPIIFQISPIEPIKYSLKNKEIIFRDSTYKYLFLKNCRELTDNNNMITRIECTVSNNIMKGNYSYLVDDQNISILPGCKINLVGDITTGGFFTTFMTQTINTNLTEAQKKDFSLTFNILYYNSTIKPGNLFPYRVYLYGIKSSNTKRNLDVADYNSKILFPNCTVGNYSVGDSNAIGSIKCLAPDYIPAGNYSKLESDGIEMMPNSSLNLVFQNDFNRTRTIISDFQTQTTGYTKSSSSKSKTWIVWVVLGVILVVLAVTVLIVCLVNRRKKGDENNNTDNRENSNANISLESKNNKSSKIEESN